LWRRNVSTKTTPIISTNVLPASSPVPTPSVLSPSESNVLASAVVSPTSSPSPTIAHEPHSRRTGTRQGKESRGIRKADALIASGQVDKALAQLRKLVSDVPNSTRGYLRMASLLRDIQRPGEALAVLRNAIERVPDVPTPREVLAEMCLEMGRWEEAIQQSRALLALSPRSLIARDVLSAAYFQSGQLEKALSVTDEMILLDPTDAANHFKRGVLLQQKGHIQGAIESFSRVLEIAPDSEAAEESCAALEMLDNYQIRQIISRAMEDVPFRLSLMQRPAETLSSYGYALSERGLATLTRISLTELPPAPPGWRQFMLQ